MFKVMAERVPSVRHHPCLASERMGRSLRSIVANMTEKHLTGTIASTI